MFRRRTFWILLGIGLLAMILAACAPPGGGEKGARGELNLLCTPQVEWCEGMKAEFGLELHTNKTRLLEFGPYAAKNRREAVHKIAAITGLKFVPAPNLFTVMGAHDALVQ
ncbi:MAG TPA: hypothetical protein EYP25_06390, partial [Anaerolineae bacterium]|nr:hypothetical protein [Anaerolineae bacterium]